MFKIIDQKNREAFEEDISCFFSPKCKDKLARDSQAYDHNHSVYIMHKDPQTGLKAGARLNPMTSKNLTSDTLKRYVKGFETAGVWECSLMVFHLEDAHPIYDDTRAFHRLCNQYYESFRETMITACVRFKIGTLIFFGYQDEVENLQYFGDMHFKPKLPLEDNLCIALFQNPHRH